MRLTNALAVAAAGVLSGCSLWGTVTAPLVVENPRLPDSVFSCADWPTPPLEAENSQKHVAAWLEGQVKPAFDDCKFKLHTNKLLFQE